GHDHQRARWRNLLLDFLWSRRAARALPAADVVVCNAVTLPTWLGRARPDAGRVVVMCGRMPKGQYRRYRHLARALAPSALVRVRGYPIDWTLLGEATLPSTPLLPARQGAEEVTLGYIGRIHEEKGLRLLATALPFLQRESGLPPWRLVVCGPDEIAQGGSG